MHKNEKKMKEISIEWSGPFNLKKLKEFKTKISFNFYFFFWKEISFYRGPIYWYIGSSSDAVKRAKYHKIKNEFRKKYPENYMDIERFLEEHPWFEDLIKSIFSGFYDRLEKLNEFIIGWLHDHSIKVYFGQGFINNKTIPADKDLILAIENGLICHHAQEELNH